MKVFSEEERENLISFWSSKQFDNCKIATEIIKSRAEEMTLEEVRELHCLSVLLSDIFGNASFIDPEDIIFSIHTFSRDNRRLKKLGFQGTRLLKRNKKDIVQFFCGRSKPSVEIEIKKPFAKLAWK